MPSTPILPYSMTYSLLPNQLSASYPHKVSRLKPLHFRQYSTVFEMPNPHPTQKISSVSKPLQSSPTHLYLNLGSRQPTTRSNHSLPNSKLPPIHKTPLPSIRTLVFLPTLIQTCLPHEVLVSRRGRRSKQACNRSCWLNVRTVSLMVEGRELAVDWDELAGVLERHRESFS
jgi:hypothetical protein